MDHPVKGADTKFMSFEAEFLEFMKDTIIRNRATSSYTSYGSPIISTAISSYRCRIVYKHELIPGDDGSEKLVTATVYVASTAAFNPEDQITFPDGSLPKILAMDAYPDEDGPYHHLILKFGR